MIRTKTITLTLTLVLLAVGAVAAQAAVPGATAQQAQPDGDTGFAVDALTAPDSAAPGSNVTVAATVTNDGEETATEAVEFRLGGTLVATENVTIAGNESTEVQFNVSTYGVEAGTYVHSVLTRDPGEFADINITAPPEPPAEETAKPETEEPETEEPTEEETDESETDEPTEEETEESGTEEPTEDGTDEQTEESSTDGSTTDTDASLALP